MVVHSGHCPRDLQRALNSIQRMKFIPLSLVHMHAYTLAFTKSISQKKPTILMLTRIQEARNQERKWQHMLPRLKLNPSYQMMKKLSKFKPRLTRRPVNKKLKSKRKLREPVLFQMTQKKLRRSRNRFKRSESDFSATSKTKSTMRRKRKLNSKSKNLRRMRMRTSTLISSTQWLTSGQRTIHYRTWTGSRPRLRLAELCQLWQPRPLQLLVCKPLRCLRSSKALSSINRRTLS